MMRTMVPPVTVELRERAPLEGPGHGFTTRRCGTRTATCELIIDPSKLEYMARKAARNKQRRARMAHGAIVVRVINSTDYKENP